MVEKERARSRGENRRCFGGRRGRAGWRRIARTYFFWVEALGRHRLDRAALQDNLANVVEALDMFVGGPGIDGNRTDTMVRLSHDIESQRSVLLQAKTSRRGVG